MSSLIKSILTFCRPSPSSKAEDLRDANNAQALVATLRTLRKGDGRAELMSDDALALTNHFVESTRPSQVAVLAAGRYLARLPGSVRSDYEDHELTACSLMLAMRYLEDGACSLAYWSLVTGLSAERLAKIERAMFAALDQDLTLGPAGA